MGQAKLHALGRNLKFFVTPETTLGTYVALGDPSSTSTKGMRVLSSSMEFGQERVDRADARGDTRSLKERITRRLECTYSVESYLLPNSNAGDEPDADLLFEAAFGAGVTGTFSAGTITSQPGYQYTLTSTQSMPSVVITREASGVVQERMRGCYVNEMTITGSGADEPKVSFSGTGIDMVTVGRSVVASADATATEVDVTAGEGAMFGTPSASFPIQIDIGSDTNVQCTGVSTDTLTIASTAFVTGDVIKPYSPGLNDSGSPINGVSGSIAVADTISAMPITAFDITVNNNTKAINDEAFTNKMTDFIPGFRSVTGNITVRANRDQIIELNKRKTFDGRDTTVTLGETSGRCCVIEMPNVEFGFSALEIPEAEEATFSMPFTALYNTADEDEITITFF